MHTNKKKRKTIHRNEQKRKTIHTNKQKRKTVYTNTQKTKTLHTNKQKRKAIHTNKQKRKTIHTNEQNEKQYTQTNNNPQNYELKSLTKAVIWITIPITQNRYMFFYNLFTYFFGYFVVNLVLVDITYMFSFSLATKSTQFDGIIEHFVNSVKTWQQCQWSW